MRLFVAVALPEAVLAAVDDLPRPDRPGVRWTTSEQWHVTLRFLGEAPPEDVIPAVAGALEGRGADDVPTVTLGPATAWFRGRRVLQIPVTGLDRLAAVVRPATDQWGPDGDVPFAGHLTVARTKGRRRGPVDLAGAPISAGFRGADIGVYASRPGPNGSVYERLSVIRLQTPDEKRR